MLTGQPACSFSWPCPPTSRSSFHLRKEVLLWPTGCEPPAGVTQVARALQIQGDWFLMKWKVSGPSFPSRTQPPHENSQLTLPLHSTLRWQDLTGRIRGRHRSPEHRKFLTVAFYKFSHMVKGSRPSQSVGKRRRRVREPRGSKKGSF